MARYILLGVFFSAIFQGLALAADAPSMPQPGQPFTIRFPDMPPTLYAMAHKKNMPTAMTIFLPKNYDAQRKCPLLILLGGGDGGPASGATVARKVTEESDFVCVDLPLFREKLDPPPAIAIRDNDFKFMWPIFKKMLAKLDQTVPNIDPAHRIIGGFSNGGHTTAGMIDEVGEEFVNYFSAFVFVEGGFKLQHCAR